MDCRRPGSSVHGISQAGIWEWVAISSSGRSSLGLGICLIFLNNICLWHHLTTASDTFFGQNLESAGTDKWNSIMGADLLWASVIYFPLETLKRVPKTWSEKEESLPVRSFMKFIDAYNHPAKTDLKGGVTSLHHFRSTERTGCKEWLVVINIWGSRSLWASE